MPKQSLQRQNLDYYYIDGSKAKITPEKLLDIGRIDN